MATLIARVSRCRIAPAAVMLACCAGLAERAGAIVIRTDRVEISHIALGAQPQFQSVGYFTFGPPENFNYASAVLISPNFAITAAHTGYFPNGSQITDLSTLSITFTGPGGTSTRGASAFNIHPGYIFPFSELGFDIAVIQLSSPVTNVTPAVLHTILNEEGHQVTTVGWGLTGNGTVGQLPNTEGVRRAGTNTIDFNGATYNGVWNSNVLLMDFDNPAGLLTPNPDTYPTNIMGSGSPLDMEDSIALGDSGGGGFIQTPNGWELAGLHSFFFNTVIPDFPPHNEPIYGYGSGMTRVSAFLNFIAQFDPSVVPSPGAATLLGFGALVLSRRRR